MDDIKKHTYELIDEILWNDWDPIGVNDDPAARNEYRTYIDKVVDLKVTGAECETIARYLFQIETDRMSLNGNLEKCRRVSQNIISLDFKQQIRDRKEFIAFLEKLYEDYISNGAKWENSTLESFLEAMVAYAKDIQGYYDNSNQPINANQASWQVFSDILEGAKIYE